jgi:hypothetical protein
MDEFKKAHRKMFKNGYVESEYQQLANDPRPITTTDSSEQKVTVS